MKIVFATGNAHKLQEINEITHKYPPLEVGSKSVISGRGQVEFILPPEGFDPVENGETFEENSLIKAREAARLSGMMSLADDSGLCVEALDGAPGIHSARYAETAQARIDKLLKKLKNVEMQRCEDAKMYSFLREQSSPKQAMPLGINSSLHLANRRAKFVCVMTLVDADGKILFQTRGECHGEIAREQSGVNGFGYDPIFIPTLSFKGGEQLTLAEMSEEEKNEISHRGKALRNVLEYLRKFPPLREEK